MDLVSHIDHLRELFEKAPFAHKGSEFEQAKVDFLASHPLHGKVQPSLDAFYEQYIAGLSRSSIYTPLALAREIFERTPVNPGDKILDAAAGTGHLSKDFIEAGYDVTLLDEDEVALAIAQMELKLNRNNLKVGNFLKLEGADSWDVIIANPPYKGHKGMSINEKKELRDRFHLVMDQKSDLYYAFFQKAQELLKGGGIASFLVSRYWLETLSGKKLRAFVLDHFDILWIHDFYGQRPFGAGVDPVIIVLKKKEMDEWAEAGSWNKQKETRFDKGAKNLEDINVQRGDDHFTISKTDLSPSSMKLLTPMERQLVRVMEENCNTTLGASGQFHQGVITGLDEAFVLEEERARHLVEQGFLEEELLVPWLKNSELLTGPKRRLIYPENGKNYPKFMNYIKAYEKKLSQRREVRLGLRPWYDLQWPRRKEAFIRSAILFAYKAPKALFVKAQGQFHSADIYGYESNLPIDWLLSILNHPLYDAYLKTKLKKLGKDLYDFYPHHLKTAKIPDPNVFQNPADFFQKIEDDLKKFN